MKNYKLLSIILTIIIVGIFSTTSGLSQTLTLTLNSSNGFDSFIQQDKATTNYGLENYIGIDSESGKSERGILFFNISSIPANSIIYNATLKLNMTSGSGAIFNVTIKRITDSWEEDSVTWNKRNILDNWASGGGDYSSINYSIGLLNNTLGIKYFNLTELVQEYVDGDYENYGFIIIADIPQGGNNEKRFASKEQGPSAPTLIIDYVSDLTPPNLTVNSPQNITYNNSNIWINISYADSSGISSVWFYNGTGNESYSSQIIRTFSEGNHDLIFYVNDSLGNINSSSVSFYVDSIKPLIDITYPSNNQNFTNASVIVNYTASDTNLESCKYSLNGASNVSITCGNNFVVSSVQGSNNVVIYANDTLGNLNSSSVSFYVDSIKPNITIYSPLNQTYGANNIFVNFSVQDQSSISSCKVYLDNILISSSCLTFSTSIGDGSHNLEIYANDTLGNLENKNVTFFADLSPPIYYNIITNSLSIYSNNNSYFNVSWSDESISSVIFESNFSGISQNYSMTNLGGNNYGFWTSIPAGTYYWKAYANDSFGNLNSTQKIEFIINKSQEGAILYLNGNTSDVNITYGETINASYYIVGGSASLYFDGLGINGGQNLNLDAGTYNFTLVFEGNQNYSAKTISYFANIAKADPELRLILNGYSSTIGIPVFSLANITAYSIEPYLENIELYENEILIDSGSQLEHIINYTTPGTYYWKINISESENYNAKELAREIIVNDANYPMPSNIISPSDATYSPTKIYSFNITWIDDIGIDEVNLELNGRNYSYKLGEIIKNGDEYYINFTSFAAGTYNYRWIANDTSGNSVSPGTEDFTISRASGSIFITVAPSSIINYGEIMSVNCIANNPETSQIITLERNFVQIVNPDSSILGSGIYNYVCDATNTQNYTDPSLVSSQLNVVKATPQTTLKLNNISEDLTLPYTGGIVEIYSELNLLYGVLANLTLYLNDQMINSSINLLNQNITFAQIAGINEIIVSYPGNENYSAHNSTRYVIIPSAPQTQSDGGGGSSGGGGGGGIIVSSNKTKVMRLEFESLGDIIISPGESKILELNARNTGDIFLNKCSLKGNENYTSWVKSDTVKNINPGEITEYIFEIKIPLEANRTDDPRLILNCVEKEFEVPIKMIILNSGMDIEIDSLELVSKEELSINYTVIGNADFEETIMFKVYDNEDNLLSEKEEKIFIYLGKTQYGSILDVSKADKGLLKIEISKKNGAVIVDEFFVYDSKQPITGFALLDKVSGDSFYIIFVLIFFLAVAFMIFKRMKNVKNIRDIQYLHSKKIEDDEKKENRNEIKKIEKEEYIQLGKNEIEKMPLPIKNERKIVKKENNKFVKKVSEMFAKPENNEIKQTKEKNQENTKKKIKFSQIFEEQRKNEAEKQKTTKLKEEIKNNEKFRFETYGKESNFETY